MSELVRSSSVHQLSKRIQQSNNKCVCQICTCGKHRCPHPHIPYRPQTTNQQYYKPPTVTHSPVRRCGYEVTASRYDSDLLKSTYQMNYKPFTCPASHAHKKYAYQPNTAKFHDDTEYKSKYVPNAIVLESPTPCPNQYRPSSGRFEARSTYQQEFKAKRGQQEQQKKHYAYHQNTLPFYGSTTYGQNFKAYQLAHDPQGTCASKYVPNPARFEAQSSYKEFYPPHRIHKQARCLVEELPRRPHECSPGKDHVHFNAQQHTWK